MRNVIRPPMPESLRKNAVQWRQELHAAIASQDKNRIRKCRNRYKKDDIKKALCEMYGGLCCYCESQIDIADFPHIEHRKPQKHYPEYAFTWDNLHLACQKCNTFKDDKWNNEHPILDSVQDTISEHLGYCLGNLGAKRWPKSHRGKTTIQHTKLNRECLLNARTPLMFNALQSIYEINDASNAPAADLVREELEQKTSGEYGSLIQWLLTTYLRDPGPANPTS